MDAHHDASLRSILALYPLTKRVYEPLFRTREVSLSLLSRSVANETPAGASGAEGSVGICSSCSGRTGPFRRPCKFKEGESIFAAGDPIHSHVAQRNEASGTLSAASPGRTLYEMEELSTKTFDCANSAMPPPLCHSTRLKSQIGEMQRRPQENISHLSRSF